MSGGSNVAFVIPAVKRCAIQKEMRDGALFLNSHLTAIRRLERCSVRPDEIWANHEVKLLSFPSGLYGLTRRGPEIFQSVVNALAASVKARF